MFRHAHKTSDLKQDINTITIPIIDYSSFKMQLPAAGAGKH